MNPATKIAIFETMERIRRLEKSAIREYCLPGQMGGFLVLSTGQESIAATVRAAMSEDDHSISGCRGIGHALAAGIPMASILAELMGRSGGSCKGKGGNFSLYASDLKHWGCHGLAAAQTPLANGLAFGLKQQSQPGAVVCFMGEGSANQGVFHETLNLAGLFNLPVVFIIENNGFGMGTSQERSSRFTGCVAKRAETYGIEWDLCDDIDIPLLHSKVSIALDRARLEHRPTVFEITTMRYYGWSIADANNRRYRTKDSIEERKNNSDPLTLWQQHLVFHGILSETQISDIQNAAKFETNDAINLAKLSPAPTKDALMDDVYWETDNKTPASQIGHHFFA